MRDRELHLGTVSLSDLSADATRMWIKALAWMSRRRTLHFARGRNEVRPTSGAWPSPICAWFTQIKWEERKATYAKNLPLVFLIRGISHRGDSQSSTKICTVDWRFSRNQAFLMGRITARVSISYRLGLTRFCATKRWWLSRHQSIIELVDSLFIYFMYYYYLFC